MSSLGSHSFRLAVVAPTYNNARWLGTMLASLAATGLDVIVVDDGCSDGSDAILRAWLDGGSPHRHVVRHDVNRGKAQAMQSGFAAAREMGFTHALTIDTDGQHDVADVLPMVEVARRSPAAMVVGTRPVTIAGYPLGSRVGRAISNLLVRLESGLRVGDSQCGLRVYPLGPLGRVRTFAGRFGYETEVLTRFAWAGGAVEQMPIHSVYQLAGGRTSHFRPWRDSWSASLMHVRLLLRAILPWPVPKTIGATDGTGTLFERFVRWFNPLRTWRQVRDSTPARETLARSVAVGAVVAAVPLYGLKTVLCLALAKALRAPPLVLIASSSLFNTPPVGAFVAAASIATGHVLLRGRWPRLASYDLSTRGFWATFKQVGVEWLVGGCVVGAGLALASYVAVRLLMKRLPEPRGVPGERSSVAPAM